MRSDERLMYCSSVKYQCECKERNPGMIQGKARHRTRPRRVNRKPAFRYVTVAPRRPACSQQKILRSAIVWHLSPRGTLLANYPKSKVRSILSIPDHVPDYAFATHITHRPLRANVGARSSRVFDCLIKSHNHSRCFKARYFSFIVS